MATFRVGTNDSGRNGTFFIRTDTLEVPDGLYFVGREVELAYRQGLSVSRFKATFAGYEEGTDYPVFYFDEARYRGITHRNGSLIGVSNSQTANTNYMVDDTDFVTNRLIGIGVETPDNQLVSVTFPDWARRRPEGEETDELTSQGRQVRVDSGVYTVGQRTTLTVLNSDGSVNSTIEADFVGYDRDTGDPIFDPTNSPRQILLPSEKTTASPAVYTVPETDIVAETLGIGVPTPGTVATFADYGLRDGTTNTYDSEGREIVIEKGAYQAGDSVRAWIVLARDENGDVSHVEHAFEATVVGHESGTGNLVLDPPSDVLSGTRIVVAEDKAATYIVNNIVTDAPLGVGFTHFTDYGLRVPGQDTYNSQSRGIEVEHGPHQVGDMVEIRIVDRRNGQAREVEDTFEATYRGYDSETGNPIFDPPTSFRTGRRIVATGTREETYTIADTDIVEAAWPLPDARYPNYGFRRANADGEFTGDFDLQGTGTGFGLDIPAGVYDNVNTFTIRTFGGDADGEAVSVTLVGHVVESFGNVIYPIFQADNFPGGPVQFIGTAEPDSVTTYTVGNIVYNGPLGIGGAIFADYGLRVGTTDSFESAGAEIWIAQGAYAPGNLITVRTITGRDADGDPEFGLTFPATFVGLAPGTGNPVLNPPNDVFDNDDGNRWFVLADSRQTDGYMVDTSAIDRASTYVTCFAPGTWIATPDGERLVETLRPGDKVLTADCGVETVKWVGVQKVHTMFGAREVTHPVRIMAGALDDNVPHTDLVVTKDHGMIVDGVICHAGALINGTSIIEVSPRELTDELTREPGTGPHGVATYYHVETENHVPLLANGAAAESFIDNVDRARFGNHSEFVALYGSNVPPMTEMALPRAMSARQVPRRITLLLAERADMILEPIAEGPVARKA